MIVGYSYIPPHHHHHHGPCLPLLTLIITYPSSTVLLSPTAREDVFGAVSDWLNEADSGIWGKAEKGEEQVESTADDGEGGAAAAVMTIAVMKSSSIVIEESGDNATAVAADGEDAVR